MPKSITRRETKRTNPDGAVTNVTELVRDFGPLHEDVENMIDAILETDMSPHAGKGVALTPAVALRVVARFVLQNAVEQARARDLDPDEEWEMIFSSLESAVWEAADVRAIWEEAKATHRSAN